MELLVSFAILSLLMILLVVMVGVTSSTWRGTQGKAEQFQQAREALKPCSAGLVRRL